MKYLTFYPQTFESSDVGVGDGMCRQEKRHHPSLVECSAPCSERSQGEGISAGEGMSASRMGVAGRTAKENNTPSSASKRATCSRHKRTSYDGSAASSTRGFSASCRKASPLAALSAIFILVDHGSDSITPDMMAIF